MNRGILADPGTVFVRAAASPRMFTGSRVEFAQLAPDLDSFLKLLTVCSPSFLDSSLKELR